MSSSIICQNFVQNAWKKELCSNCFKSKDEHRKSAAGVMSASSAIAAMLKSTANNNLNNIKNKATFLTKISPQQAKTATTQEADEAKNDSSADKMASGATDGKREPIVLETKSKPKTKSIIKTPSTSTAKSPTFGKNKPKRTVNFKVKLAQVIGYGGEDWSEEEEDVVAYEETVEVDAPSEEEKELNRLTKLNTDFNTNLTCKKLQLGKPLMDAEGKKQTLLVQVTPFGQDSKDSTVKQKITMCNKFIKSNNNQQNFEVKEVKTSKMDTQVNNPSSPAVGRDQRSENLKESEDVVDFLKVMNVKNGNNVKEDNEKFKEVTEEFNALNDTKILKIDGDKVEKSVKEKSLLDEITETLEKSKISVNPTKKIVQREIILKPSAVAPPLKAPSTKLTRNPAIKEKKTYQSSKSLNLIIDSEKDKNENSINKKDAFDDKDSANGGSSLDDSSSHCGSEGSNDSNSDSSLEAVKPNLSYENVNIPSREQAGEPDGRAESDGTDEPIPALPVSPPPGVGGASVAVSGVSKQQPVAPISPEKPKIPTKPSTILIRKPPSVMAVNQVVLSTFNSDKNKFQKMAAPMNMTGVYSNLTPSSPEPAVNAHAQLQKRDSNGSDISKKRKAPKPPQEESSNSIYMRKITPMSNNDCPVVREKEKRERASSCTPKMSVGGANGPEPAPRRSLSLSTDSLASNGEEKKKRGKFSLKKLLRMGGSGSSKAEEEKPLPKPRLVIVHPLDMKAHAQKVDNEQEYVNTTFLKEQIQQQKDKENARPPPPPRNYENYEKPDKLPPKTAQIKNLPMQMTSSVLKKPSDSVYANIGEVRNAITPNKPQRTASMREIKDGVVVSRNAYEPVMALQNENSKTTKDKSEEHVYDYIGNRSSSPECDSKGKMATLGGVALSHGQNGAPGGMSRSVSMTYCGSETESEIYSPYSYYGSESEVAEDEQECCYGNGLGSTGRTHKLRSKKGRSIVHKNLEDNYGAVVVANHEALAQVLENIQQTIHVPLQLRALKTAENLRWNDFTLRPTVGANPGTQSIIIGNCSFHQASWNQQNVTLMITVVPNSPSCSLGTLILQPVTEFSDLVPPSVLQATASPQLRQKVDPPLQATISVLAYLQINSVLTIGECLKAAKTSETSEVHKASTVILLQLVNSMKTLQAQGVEELPLNLNSFVLAKDVEKQEAHSRLYILHPNEDARQEMGTLCLVVSKAMDLLPVDGTLKRLIQSLLSSERAVTLSQVKSVLEFSLWGPSDVALGSTASEREFVLQRWLDLQRATVLHGLVCAKVQLTVYEECHLLFLVRSNAKMMCDASLLLESVRAK